MANRFSLYPLKLRQGVLALCPLPGGGGDMDEDLTILARFRPDLIVSLTQAEELRVLGCADLPKRLSALGLASRVFEIPDYGTPANGADWPMLSAALHHILRSGGRVALHCRGGLGRSGMVALRLMLEAGEDPSQALARLRLSRPGAVETDAQLDWATRPTP